MTGLVSRTSEAAIFAVWTVIVIGLLAFWPMASREARRRAQPYAVTFVGLVVLLFAWLEAGSQGFFFALIPVAIIVWLNITAEKTCGRCGNASRTTAILPVAKYCIRCGSELEDPKAG